MSGLYRRGNPETIRHTTRQGCGGSKGVGSASISTLRPLKGILAHPCIPSNLFFQTNSALKRVIHPSPNWWFLIYSLQKARVQIPKPIQTTNWNPPLPRNWSPDRNFLQLVTSVLLPTLQAGQSQANGNRAGWGKCNLA